MATLDRSIFEQAHLRNARYYAYKLNQLGKQFTAGGENAIHAVTEFDDEWIQIQHAQQWSASSDSLDGATLCIQFATTASALREARISLQEKIAWLEQSLQAAQHINDHETVLEMFFLLATEVRGERAQQYLNDATQYAQKHNLTEPLLPKLLALGRRQITTNDMDHARQTFNRMLTIAERQQDVLGLARASHMLAHVEEDSKNPLSAIDYIHQAISFYEQLEDTPAVTIALARLGSIHLDLEDYEQALTYLNQAYAYADETQNELHKIHIGMLRTSAYTDSNQWQAAKQEILKVYKISQTRDDNLHYRYGSVASLCFIEYQLENYREALQYGSTALKQIRDDDGAWYWLVETLCLYALVRINCQPDDIILDDLTEALQIAQDYESVDYQHLVLAVLAHYHILSGEDNRVEWIVAFIYGTTDKLFANLRHVITEVEKRIGQLPSQETFPALDQVTNHLLTQGLDVDFPSEWVSE